MTPASQRSSRRAYDRISEESSSNRTVSRDEESPRDELEQSNSSQLPLVDVPEIETHIEVVILDSAQQKFSINADPSWKISHFKKAGFVVHKVHPAKQRLISMGRLLDDETTLQDCGITESGKIIHLFPKPNVVIDNEETRTENGEAQTEGQAHVPEIRLNSEELSRQSEILVLATHEAYETVNRVRLLSFLLLVYFSMETLRDISMWVSRQDQSDENTVYPPGDPTDTSPPGEMNPGDLPPWQDRDYISLAISALGLYVSIIGIKATTEHIPSLARRFIVLLTILLVSWNVFYFYVYVNDLKSRPEVDDEKVYQEALFAISLPLFLWVTFYIRAYQFYKLLREAEIEAGERTAILTGDEEQAAGNGQRSDNDLELQVEDRTID